MLMPKKLTKKQEVALLAARNRLEHALRNTKIACLEAANILGDARAYAWVMMQTKELMDKTDREDKRAKHRKTKKRK
jgi:hypothetical protein